MKCYASKIIDRNNNVVTDERFVKAELLLEIMEQVKKKLTIEKFPIESGIEYCASVHIFTDEELEQREQDIERDILAGTKKKKPLR